MPFTSAADAREPYGQSSQPPHLDASRRLIWKVGAFLTLLCSQLAGAQRRERPIAAYSLGSYGEFTHLSITAYADGDEAGVRVFALQRANRVDCYAAGEHARNWA